MQQSDVTIKQYNSGKFAGKYAAFFNTDKAKKVLTSFGNDNGVIAGIQSNLPKVEAFCERNQLHYEYLIIN